MPKMAFDGFLYQAEGALWEVMFSIIAERIMEWTQSKMPKSQGLRLETL